MRISPIHLKILAYTLDVEGHNASTVLRQCGIASADDLHEDGEWLPVSLFDRMMAAAITETKDAHFGLVVGKSIALMRYGAIVPLMLSAQSLRQMLADISRFAKLSLSQSELELVETTHSAHLMVRPVVQGGLSGPFRTEQVATSAVQMLRLVGASYADIYQVDFAHSAPDGHAHRYATAFGARINFNQTHCAVSFNPALLDIKLPSHDPIAHMASRTRAEALLAAMTTGSDMAESVRQWLLSSLPNLPTVCETAKHVGMSERSFRRHLGTLQTSHAELTQECQRLMAERLLSEGKQPLKQIAQAIGFDSVTSFHRAFMRWSGLTPSAWRDNCGAASITGQFVE